MQNGNLLQSMKSYLVIYIIDMEISVTISKVFFHYRHDHLCFHLQSYHYIHIVKCNTKLPAFVTIHDFFRAL